MNAEEPDYSTPGREHPRGAEGEPRSHGGGSPEGSDPPAGKGADRAVGRVGVLILAATPFILLALLWMLDRLIR